MNPTKTGTVTTITIFTVSDRSRLWAFAQMAFGRLKLRNTTGLVFWQLMGTGRGLGFSATPDWNRYVLFAVWTDADAAEKFQQNSTLVRDYTERSMTVETITLACRQAHGRWNGQQPFECGRSEEKDGPIAVLTRATIRLRRLFRFWKMVAPVSDQLSTAPGLSMSIGIGEFPWIRQATFSIWQSEEAMKAFAYSTERHREVVRRTRDEDWYREDLFARFEIKDRVIRTVACETGEERIERPEE